MWSHLVRKLDRMVDHKELNTCPADLAHHVVIVPLARIALGNKKRPEAARLESKDCLSNEDVGLTVSERRLERLHVGSAIGIVQVIEDSLRLLLDPGWHMEGLAEG